MAALVCDSCPCYPDVRVGARAIHTGVGGGIVGSLMSSAFTSWTAAVSVFARVAGSGGDYFGSFWNFVEHLDVVASAAGGDHVLPRLYLYSRDDHLCDCGRLERVIASRRKEASRCGAIVRSVEFSVPSGHVTHLMRHRERYTSAVKAFLGDVGARDVSKGRENEEKLTGVVVRGVDATGSSSSMPQPRL